MAQSILNELNELIDGFPTSIDDLEKLPLYSILMVVGGYIAVGLGSIHFFITVIVYIDIILVFHFIVNLLFGIGLLVCHIRIEKDDAEWILISALFSIILITLGGPVGTISGIVSVLGSILALIGEIGQKDWLGSINR